MPSKYVLDLEQRKIERIYILIKFVFSFFFILRENFILYFNSNLDLFSRYLSCICKVLWGNFINYSHISDLSSILYCFSYVKNQQNIYYKTNFEFLSVFKNIINMCECGSLGILRLDYNSINAVFMHYERAHRYNLNKKCQLMIFDSTIISHHALAAHKGTQHNTDVNLM